MMNEEEQKRYYGFCTLMIIGSIFLSGFLVSAIITQINFSNHGVYTSARIDKIHNRAGYEYDTSFILENDSVITTTIKSREELGGLGDSIEIYYIKSNSDTGLASDVKGYKSIIILSCLDVLFITIIIMVIKNPKYLLRYKGTLDQY